MRTAVGIATRGDVSLTPLFEQLAAQSTVPDLVIIGTSRPPIVEDVAAASRLALRTRYESTATAGYAVNRNAVLDAANAESVIHLCWIDDDERPDSEWIAELVRIGRTFGAQIVLGPVRRSWPVGAPRWARRADLPARAEYEDGPCEDPGRTGNCLMVLDSDSLRGLTFDPRFDQSGGEDVDYIERARGRGAAVAWSSRAVVHERANAEMFAWSWYVRRAWRTGRVNGSMGRRLDWRRPPKGALLLVAGIVTLRADRVLRCAWEFSFFAGQVSVLSASHASDSERKRS